MTLHYNKHLETKNKWQNQQISKHFKNRSGYRYKWNKDNKHKPYEIDAMDIAEYELSINYNSIPVWDCPYCTYKNIERKSFCNICNVSYLSNTALPIHVGSSETNHDLMSSSKAMTLGQFCKNVWDALSIPVWICSQCTYCNIEQLPKCQMCFNPYDSNQQIQQTTEYTNTINTESYSEIYEEHYSENLFENDEYKDDIYTNTNSTANINITKCIEQKDEDMVTESKVKVSVTIKLTTNKLYQKAKSERLQAKYEDILRHTLLEAQLDIYTMNDTLIKSHSYIPALKHNDDTFTACYDTIIVPIKYKYRNHFGEFGYFPNNNPLKCVAEFIWKAHYPYLDEITCPYWEFMYPEDKNVRSPAQKRYILDAIIPFLPLKDVITVILFPYLGYDELEVVKIHTTYDQNVNYFEKYKLKNFEKDLFMVRNNGKLPFTICSNAWTTIKIRKIDMFLKLTEIGCNYNLETGANNYWLNKRDTKRRRMGHRYSAVWSKYVDLLYRKYGKKEPRNRHDRKMKRRYNSKARTYADTSQFYPKKYLYLRNYGSGGKRNWKKSVRRNRRWYITTEKKKRKQNKPRYGNELVKWYLQKDKRYTDRKWSAYWKLNERNIC